MIIKIFPCHTGVSRYLPWFIFILLLFAATPFLEAQSENTESRLIRLTWAGGEHALHYAVEIERSENGNNRSYSRETTTSLHMDVSLPLGEYRFRIIPYDILGRPAEGTEWMHFAVHSARRGPEHSEQIQVVDTDDYDPATGKLRTNSPFFNTIGFSAGMSYDPKYFIAVHGTFALKPNWFVEVGFDIGLRSTYQYEPGYYDQWGVYYPNYENDVEDYYSYYPYVNLGYFIPFNRRGGFLIGAGVGYMIGTYTFEYGEADVRVLSANFTAGINLLNFLNISYTLRTDFGSANSKIALGVVYRFKKEDSDNGGDNDVKE